jgi:hypothetical protein
LAPARAAYVVKAAAVGDQIKIVVIERRIQSAAFAPINDDVLFARALLGKPERRFGKVDAVDFKVLLCEEDRIGSRSASQVKHPSAGWKSCPKYIANKFC